MKGYELYSWEVNDGWNFTLITGTNRVKTYGEIYSSQENVSEENWVNLKFTDVEFLKEAMKTLPEGEKIVWCDDSFLSGEQNDMPPVSFPDNDIIDDLVAYCSQVGISLTLANID